jgi:hypothetical protein
VEAAVEAAAQEVGPAEVQAVAQEVEPAVAPEAERAEVRAAA